MSDERTRIIRPGPGQPQSEKTNPTGRQTSGGAPDPDAQASPPAADFHVTRWSTQSSLKDGEILVNTYRVDKFVARGGMGTVYRATHILLNTVHAIKMILSDLADNPDVLEALTREANALRRVRNDAVVDYEGLFVDDRGRRFLVMQYVDGPSLGDYIKDNQLTPAEVRTLKDRLALGLGAAHEVGIVHRDISPDNIILRDGRIDEAVLIDFGISKLIEADPAAAQRSIFGGDFVGKYAFASPEHFSGNVERRSDIYSLGLVLATAAIGHGQRLKMGSSLTEMTLARQKLPDMAPVPEELRHEIAAMLQPLPENRPQGMYDIVDPEVRKWHLDRETTELAGDGVSRKILIGIGVCVGVLVVLAAGHVIYPRPLLSLLGIRTHVVASEIQHRVDAALRCKSASVAVSQNYMFRTEATLTGIVANQDDSKMATALASGPKIDRVANQLKIEPWPFCDVIEMARAVDGDAGARVLPAIDGGAKDFVFHENQFLRLTVDASSLFNGYLYVDYFDPDGNVMHMLPNGRRKVNKVTAGQKVTIGNAYNKEKYAGYTCNSPARRDDAADYTYQICSPFGKDMIMAISSPRPLFPKPRQVTETAAAYLSALRKVMAHPRSPADAPVISYRIMTTQPAASPARPQ